MRWAARVARCSGLPVKGIAFRRPSTVQMDTVRAWCCQDRQRSSNGWAAVGRKVTGAASMAMRLSESFLPRLPAFRLAFSVA